MKVPDKFPPGCVFGMDRADGDGVELSYVEFPDGKRFVLDERDPGAGLKPTTSWPLDWRKLSEESFMRVARAA